MVVWRYDLLVAGLGAVDDVSLATSLAGLADEGVTGELEGCSTRRGHGSEQRMRVFEF